MRPVYTLFVLGFLALPSTKAQYPHLFRELPGDQPIIPPAHLTRLGLAVQLYDETSQRYSPAVILN